MPDPAHEAPAAGGLDAHALIVVETGLAEQGLAVRPILAGGRAAGDAAAARHRRFGARHRRAGLRFAEGPGHRPKAVHVGRRAGAEVSPVGQMDLDQLSLVHSCSGRDDPGARGERSAVRGIGDLGLERVHFAPGQRQDAGARGEHVRRLHRSLFSNQTDSSETAFSISTNPGRGHRRAPHAPDPKAPRLSPAPGPACRPAGFEGPRRARFRTAAVRFLQQLNGPRPACYASPQANGEQEPR